MLRTALKTCGAALLTTGLATGAAHAEDWTQGWSGQATVYGWLPTINGSQEGRDGSPIVDLDAADVLDALDFAFMGTVQVRKGKFGLLFDAVYADLSQGGKLGGQGGRGGVNVEAGTKLGIYTAAATYRVYDAGPSYVDVYAGARHFDSSLSFDISGPDRGLATGADLAWTDGIVGIHGGVPLTERWSVSGFADVGGFDANSDLSWEVYGGGDYAFSDAWTGIIGYRYMSITYQANDRATLDIDVQGPVFGVSYRF